MNEEGKSNLAVPPENVLTDGHSAQDSKEGIFIMEDETEKKNNASKPMTEEEITPGERMNTADGDKLAGNIEESYPCVSETNTCYEQPDENSDMKTRAKTTKSVSGVPGKYLKRNLMSIVQQKLAENLDIGMQLRKKNDVVLNVLDFAGQGTYYSSHQTYIRKNAIYIIVFDVSRDLDERKVVPCGRPCSLFSCWTQKDFMHYWLNTIRVHAGKCENIFLVGTHGNKKRDDLNLNQLCNNFYGLLPENLAEITTDISRSSEQEKNEKEDEGLKKLKDSICKAVLSSKRKVLPTKWMKYERAFDIIKSEEETPVIKIDELLEIIDHMEIEMRDVEIHDMLRYFHNNGSILFFDIDRLREIIILDIQWFVDCFKDIITDQGHAKQRNGEIHKKCLAQSNLFFETGLLDSTLYRNLLTANSVTLPQEIGEYLQKLGMMIYMGKLNTRGFDIPYADQIDAWYVPCVNTKEFKPEKEKYENTEASSILCFRFKEYLPMDLFGRMIVLCLSSGKWQVVGGQLCREGAHMRYCDKEEKNLNQVDVYLFTARKLLTVQIINRRKPKLHGKGVKAEIQDIIEELQANFYACLLNCEIGFLCSKEKGYDESSVKHFIPMTSGREYCADCPIEPWHVNIKQACDFWGVSSEEDSISKPITRGKGKNERQWIAVCYHAYLKVRERILLDCNAEKDMGFGTFYTSMLEKRYSMTANDSHSAKDQKAKMEKIDSFVDIGQKLKHIMENSDKSNGDEKENIAEIKDSLHSLKKISLAFDDEDRSLRRKLFFLWTDTVEDIQLEDICRIPKITLTVPKFEFGDDVKLKASVDVDVSHFIWLKKNDGKNKFEILSEFGKSTPGQMRSDSYELKYKRLSKDDEGQYQLIVATKESVGTRTFQLHAVDETKVDGQRQTITDRHSDTQNSSRIRSLKEDTSDVNSFEVGDDTTVQQLPNNGADINLREEHKTTPLCHACYLGQYSTVQLLLNYGADINLCEKKNGASPLYKACQKGHDSTVQLLLNNGAEINLCRNDGTSPLYKACQNGHDSTVELLLNNGADINLCDKNGASPLFMACQKGRDSTVRLLLNNGADINLCQNDGSSPLFIACQEVHVSTVQLLLKNGADMDLFRNDGVSPLLLALSDGGRLLNESFLSQLTH